MAQKYVIWDKTSNVITPIGEVLTPEEWIARRAIAGLATTVVAGGAINGAYFGIYDEMVDMYERLGCDFSGCTTEQEHLDAIEAFEDLSGNSSSTVSAEERIAAALEAQVMMSMPDEDETTTE